MVTVTPAANKRKEQMKVAEETHATWEAASNSFAARKTSKNYIKECWLQINISQTYSLLSTTKRNVKKSTNYDEKIGRQQAASITGKPAEEKMLILRK